MPESASFLRCFMPLERVSVKARYSPGCFAVRSVMEKSRTCSSWIWASRSGVAAGFFRPDQPRGASSGSVRSTTRLRAESAVRAVE
ncbi:hypothetical protein SCALM49S_07993 [Streptomyces californicus]